MARPQIGDYNSFYQTYLNYTVEQTVAELIDNYTNLVENFVLQIPQEKANDAYAINKWTVKQVIQHMIDTERIMSYRALAIARGETQYLPGFDENAYANNATAANRTLQQLKDEFIYVRKSSNCLIQSFTSTELTNEGFASGNSITCNALCFIIFGHNLHHKRILEERYW
jgi:uncharacterized damage-inducible protein DinB